MVFPFGVSVGDFIAGIKVQWSIREKEKASEFMQHLNTHVAALQMNLLIFEV